MLAGIDFKVLYFTDNNVFVANNRDNHFEAYLTTSHIACRQIKNLLQKQILF